MLRAFFRIYFTNHSQPDTRSRVKYHTYSDQYHAVACSSNAPKSPIPVVIKGIKK